MLTIWMAMILGLGQPVFGATEDGSDAAAGSGRPAARGQFRRQHREQMEKYLNATPEQRQQMRVDRIVNRMSRIYDLTADQRTTVTAEVKKMQLEYRSGLGGDAAELDQLENQLADLMKKHMQASGGNGRRGRPAADPEARAVREKIKDFRKAHPFDMKQAVSRIEALLPADQVAAGQQKRQEMLTRREQRGFGPNDANGADDANGPGAGHHGRRHHPLPPPPPEDDEGDLTP